LSDPVSEAPALQRSMATRSLAGGEVLTSGE
jgi:hypothetical protein